MRIRRLTAVLLMFGLVTACGWSPPSAPPPEPDRCAPADGPTAETVTTAISALPVLPQGPWQEAARGHTKNCHLYWVQVAAGSDPAAPQHLLMFDHNSPVGTATPEPKPFTTVLHSGEDTVTVNYLVEKSGQNPEVGQVRFQLDDGKIKALDPIPS